MAGSCEADDARRLKGVVFDLDGTLTLPSDLSFGGLRERFGIPAQADIMQYTAEVIGTESSERAAAVHAAVAALEADAVAKMQLQPFCAETLRHLRQTLGLRLALLTRNTRAAVDALTEKLGGWNPFEISISREDLPELPHKPHPAPVQHAAAAWNVAPEELAVVGDFVHDLECGNAAGARTVLLRNARNGRYAALATCTVDSIAELCPLFDAWSQHQQKQQHS